MTHILMSSPRDHIYMISRGWRHEELQNMPEQDFLYWLDQQRHYDIALKEAQEGAMQQTRNGAV